MISFFRRFLTSKVGAVLALLFLAVIGVAFALSDATSLTSGGLATGNNVARVGDRDITSQEIRQRLQLQLRQAQQQNPALTMEQFVADGALDRLLEQTIDLYALEQYARARGIGIDRATIDAQITSTPGFTGLDGRFSEDTMRQALQQQGLTVDEYRANLANGLLVRQLIAPMGTIRSLPAGVNVPYTSLLLERRLGEAVFVPSSRFQPTAAPTEAQLTRFYTSQRRRYTLPEQRIVRYAIIDQSSVRTVAPVTDADIAAEFETSAAEFAARENRRFQQVIASSRAAADRIAAAVRGGQSIDAAARAAGLSVATVNATSKAQFAASTSSAVADAAFAGGQGALVGPLQVPLGFVVLRVDAVDSTPARTLAQVSPLLRERLEGRRREEALVDLFNSAQDALSGGASVAEVAADKGLTVQQTPPIQGNGRSPSQPSFQLSPALAPVAAAAFQLHEGDPGQVVTIAEGRVFAIIDTPRITAAAPPPLATIRDRVVSDWRQAEGARQARDRARRILAAVEGGQSMSAAATAAGTPASVQQIAARRLETVSGQVRVPPEIALLFSMEPQEVKTLELPGDSGWMVIRLARIEPGDATGQDQLINAVSQEFVQAIGADYVGILVAAARAEFPVSTNADAVRALRQQLLGRAGT